MKKRVLAFVSAVAMMGTMTVIPTAMYSNNIDAIAVDTTVTKDYTITSEISRIAEFENCISDYEVKEENGINTYTWYAKVEAQGEVYDKGLMIQVADDGVKYQINVNLANEFFKDFKEKNSGSTEMIFTLPEPLKIKFNEAFIDGTLESSTKIYSDNNHLNLTKRYDNDENFVTYAEDKRPELNVTYTSDRTIGIQAYGNMGSVGVVNADILADYELHYVKIKNNDGLYFDLNDADAEIEIFGYKFSKSFDTNINEVLSEKTTKLLYTKNFDTSVGEGYFSVDNNEKCKVIQTALQSELEEKLKDDSYKNYMYGNYFQLIGYGRDGGDYHSGTETPVFVTIKKVINEDFSNTESFNKNIKDNVVYYYDEYYDDSNEKIGKIFDFDCKMNPYFHSGVISDANFSLKECKNFKENEIIISEGFKDTDVSNVVDNELAFGTEIVIGNDILGKIFPDKDGKGDINEDGSVNIADGILLQKYLLGTDYRTLDETGKDVTVFNSYNADMYSDDILNVFDLIMLKNKLIK